jgi:hypothetical protein
VSEPLGLGQASPFLGSVVGESVRLVGCWSGTPTGNNLPLTSDDTVGGRFGRQIPNRESATGQGLRQRATRLGFPPELWPPVLGPWDVPSAWSSTRSAALLAGSRVGPERLAGPWRGASASIGASVVLRRIPFRRRTEGWLFDRNALKSLK